MRLALIGDVHALWTDADTQTFNRSDYDALLLTGDLPGRDHALLPVARRLAGLTPPAILIPGNHDGPTGLDVLREALWNGMHHPEASAAMGRRVDALVEALGPVTVGGYSLHGLGAGADAVEVLVCRPHAMDSRHLTFARYMADRHQVGSLEASTQRLCDLVDASTRPLVFLAHNGPHGFGAHRDAPWGLPLFRRDNGDTDLTLAIRHALNSGKRVAAVVAGHMHYRPRSARAWQVRSHGVLYINAARVPRIDRTGHHHLCLEIADGHARCRAVVSPP